MISPRPSRSWGAEATLLLIVSLAGAGRAQVLTAAPTAAPGTMADRVDASLQACLTCYANPADQGCWAVSAGGIGGTCLPFGFQCAGSADIPHTTNCTAWAAGLAADLRAEAACAAGNTCGSCIVGGCYWLVREGVCTAASTSFSAIPHASRSSTYAALHTPCNSNAIAMQ